MSVRCPLMFLLSFMTLTYNPDVGAQEQRSANRWEREFRSIPDTARLREYMRRLSARPHHLGSTYGKENAEWILARFKEWGWNVQIESFQVLFPSPRERVVELMQPVKFAAALNEPVVTEDPSSLQQQEQLAAYNAFSIDGDVTAPLVYVNYGIPADYEQLGRMGISVRGCIVIARYGASWRGIKPKVAAEHGAVGCLIYSDPRGDGYFHGATYPDGPWRPPDGVQRGSVMDMPLYPGDPLTPGVGATEQAKRLPLNEAKTLTAIPVLPISYADAQPLLSALSGRVAPEHWRGALPITYRIGPGPAKVHLGVRSNWNMVRLYNVIARMEGSTHADQWVIRGNHHDAWVNGAEDPVSGLVAMMEEARGLGALAKRGWKPRRTIIYCAWDGEEQGLFGSTEWVEAHADELRGHAALYINTDSNGRGYLSMAGSHSLEKFINDVAKEVEDPEKRISVWKRRQLFDIESTSSAEERNELRQRADLRIDALGSGSDYTAFIDHLGIASLNLGYGGEDGGGIYHSIYDTFRWYTQFSDTSFVYGRALAQMAGSAVVRFAEADLMPFEFSNSSEALRKYLEELKKLASGTRDQIIERNLQLEEGVFEATADPREAMVSPIREEVPPFLNFAPLENALATVEQSAHRYREESARFVESGKKLPPGINRKLLQTERSLIHPDGLPERSWFKHQIYAPGFYTGYGVKTMPAVREAIERKAWKDADQQIVRLASVLEAYAFAIDAATNELTSARR